MLPEFSTPTKTCLRCSRDLPVAAFSRRRSRRDGLQAWCKTCQATYRHDNRDTLLPYLSAYRATHREETAAYNAAYRAGNIVAVSESVLRAESRERDALRQAAYYEAHRAVIAAYGVAYRASHHDEFAAARRNRDARNRHNGGTHTAADVQAQYARQKGRCYYCAEKVGDRYHVDHVMPLVLRGSNGPENLVITCPSCNQSKGAKHPMDFCGRLL